MKKPPPHTHTHSPTPRLLPENEIKYFSRSRLPVLPSFLSHPRDPLLTYHPTGAPHIIYPQWAPASLLLILLGKRETKAPTRCVVRVWAELSGVLSVFSSATEVASLSPLSLVGAVHSYRAPLQDPEMCVLSKALGQRGSWGPERITERPSPPTELRHPSKGQVQTRGSRKWARPQAHHSRSV